MKHVFLLFTILLSSNIIWAQSAEDKQRDFESFSKNARAEFGSFQQQTKKEYNAFRDKVNQEYADFLRKTWEHFQSFAAIPQPKDEPVPPVVIKDEDKEKPIEDNPIIIDEVIDIPDPEPQPQPIEPIQEEPQPQPVQKFSFTLYGTQMQVSLTPQHRFALSSIDEDGVAQGWERLAQSDYDKVINECLALRTDKQLCDWSYLRMLDKMSTSFFGGDTNEAELLKAYIYCQSGYQMRLAFMDNRLVMLYGSQHQIYDKIYWIIDDQNFYSDYVTTSPTCYISDAIFPHEKALSLYVPYNQGFESKLTPPRSLQSSDVDWLIATAISDENLLAFCESYPTSCINDNPVTRWAMYANKPLSPAVRASLYPILREYIADRSTAEAVDILCHWVQTAFVYEYDDEVWGDDRAFFAEETLYYPYADCEDRSILLTRIVRDLLGLDCALVYYPGHLATAIAVGDDVKGDYLIINNKRFLVCDPTYIGAPIGMTMPDMDNATAKVIVLD